MKHLVKTVAEIKVKIISFFELIIEKKDYNTIQYFLNLSKKKEEKSQNNNEQNLDCSLKRKSIPEIGNNYKKKRKKINNNNNKEEENLSK